MFLKFCTRILKPNTRKELFFFFEFPDFGRLAAIFGSFGPISNFKVHFLENRSSIFEILISIKPVGLSARSVKILGPWFDRRPLSGHFKVKL